MNRDKNEEQDEISLLFRKQASTNSQGRYLGNIHLARHASLDVIAIFAIAILISFGLFAYFATFQKKARLPGLVIFNEGVVAVAPQESGTIVEILAKEGEALEADQPLFRITSDRRTAKGDFSLLMAKAIDRRREAINDERIVTREIAQHRATVLHAKRRGIERNIDDSKLDLAKSNRIEQHASIRIGWYRDLEQKGFFSKIQAHEKEEEFLTIQSKVIAANRNLTNSIAEFNEVAFEIKNGEMLLKNALNKLERELSALDQEGLLNDRAHMIITSPVKGSLAALHVRSGSNVQGGQSIATVQTLGKNNKNKIGIDLYAASKNIGFVEKGQKIWVRVSAYPYQKYGMLEGTIESISSAPINQQELPIGLLPSLTSLQSNEPLYRVKAILKEGELSHGTNELNIVPGMLVDADVMKERRSILEWAFEPLIGAYKKSRNTVN
ncbi:HlyD family efflux transporter periplasmic adaptor subunit [Variovorax sp. H27-G14]|uniref:HlyD family efflux transporter periplasmic adaptor subunit n=1 Tax=Variovorax sp. H27-G14 TaxID=3111914 RepID=UPI0038FCB380